MGESLHFTRHRGDGWQVALAEPKYALRSALAFRAALRSLGSEFDSYIGIAEGEVSGPIEANLNDRTEDVFVKSGRGVDLAKQNPSAIRIIHMTDDAVSATAILADHISKDWTPVQANILLRFMHPNEDKTYTEVAARLEKSRQTITKSLASAAYEPLIVALKCLEEVQGANHV
jgi:hypothetical protein